MNLICHKNHFERIILTNKKAGNSSCKRFKLRLNYTFLLR